VSRVRGIAIAKEVKWRAVCQTKMNELLKSFHHVKQSIDQVSVLSSDMIAALFGYSHIRDHVVSVAESIDVLLIHANQLVTDGISLLIPSTTTIGRTVKGAVASIIARALMRRLMAKITIMRIIKLLLVLLFMALSPAPRPHHHQIAHAHGHAHAADTDDDSDDDVSDGQSDGKKRSRGSSHDKSQSLLMAAITEAPEFGKEMLTLGRTYWRLATRTASLIRTILDVMKRQSKNWNEMIQLVLRLANIADASTNNRSISSSSSSSSSSSLLSTMEMAESIITRVRDGITRMSTPSTSSSTLSWNSQSSSSSLPSSSSSSSSLPKRSTSDIVNTASRPPFTTLRSSL